MTNPVHLLTVAALLLVSFLVGATIGTVLRLMSLRAGRRAPVTAASAAPEAPAAAPLVATPVIAPLPVAPKPTAPSPADVPVPDFAATMFALASEPELSTASPLVPDAPQMQPAHVAGQTTSGILVPAPLHENPIDAPAAAPPDGPTADVIPFPAVAANAETSGSKSDSGKPDRVAEPVSPQAIVVETELPPPDGEVAEKTESAAGTEDEPMPEIQPVSASDATEDQEQASADDTVGVVDAEAVKSEPAESPVPVSVDGEGPKETEAVWQPAAVAAPVEPIDEDAAMRAIEGAGAPRRAATRKGRPVDPPEDMNEAVAASKRAVTAARRTAEAVVAEVAEVNADARADIGRPAGLDKPREGGKDDLSHIIGVLPVIETALNKLGIYHFDQLGELTDDNLTWIEGHLGIPGRIGRELWREQARELAAVSEPKRAAEK